MNTYRIEYVNSRTHKCFLVTEQPRHHLDSRSFRLIRSLAAEEAREDFAKSFELRRSKLCFGSMVEARIYRNGIRIGTVISGAHADATAWTDVWYNGKIQPIRGWFA